MVKVENSVVVNRPIKEVFAIYADPRNQPQWDRGLLEVRIKDGPLATGAEITEVRKFLGRRNESTQVVIAYEPNARIWYRVHDPFPGEAGSIFEQTPEGTKVTTRLQLEVGGFFGLAEPLVAASAKRSMKSTMGDFKDLLESGALTTTTPAAGS